MSLRDIYAKIQWWKSQFGLTKMQHMIARPCLSVGLLTVRPLIHRQQFNHFQVNFFVHLVMFIYMQPALKLYTVIPIVVSVSLLVVPFDFHVQTSLSK